MSEDTVACRVDTLRLGPVGAKAGGSGANHVELLVAALSVEPASAPASALDSGQVVIGMATDVAPIQRPSSVDR